jgi:hypothetical protein
MKKVFNFLILGAIVFSSCSKDDTKPSQFSIDGSQYNLNIGTIDDYGTNNNLTYRSYSLELKDKETKPSAYIKFRMYSPSTTRLEEGTYSYTYDNYEKNRFSWVVFAHSLVYDNNGVITSGKIFDEEDYLIVGTITVGKNSSIYTFDFDFTATDRNDNSRTYSLKGHFEKTLTEY